MSKDNNMNGGGSKACFLVCNVRWVLKHFPFLIQPKNNITYLYNRLTMQQTNDAFLAFLVTVNPDFLTNSTYRFGGKKCSTFGVDHECNLEEMYKQLGVLPNPTLIKKLSTVKIEGVPPINSTVVTDLTSLFIDLTKIAATDVFVFYIRIIDGVIVSFILINNATYTSITKTIKTETDNYKLNINSVINLPALIYVYYTITNKNVISSDQFIRILLDNLKKYPEVSHDKMVQIVYDILNKYPQVITAKYLKYKQKYLELKKLLNQ